MLNQKALDTKVLEKLSDMKVLRKTYTATTNESGAIDVRSVIPSNAIILAVATSSQANALCVPWKYNNATWFVKIVWWDSWNVFANTSFTLVIDYIIP